MSQTLDVDRRGKLVLWYDEQHLHLYDLIPTSRRRPRKPVIGFDPLIAVANSLKHHLDTGIIIPTEEAFQLIEKIKKDYREKRRRIRSAETKFKKNAGLVPVPLKTDPYEHQVRAFGFCSALYGAALFMEQGTGKTLVAIALIGHRWLEKGVRRVLVVCPKSVIPIWPKELGKHADFEWYVHRSKAFQVPGDRSDLVVWVINYDRIRNNEKAIAKWKPEFIILDESHRIKNRGAKRSASLHRLGKLAKYRLLMTGTPIGQAPLDVYSQYLFCDRDIFGTSYPAFRGLYAEMGGYMGKEIQGYKNMDAFAEKVHSISFRATKAECLELPERVYLTSYCELSKETRRIYKELEEDFYTKIPDLEGELHDIDVDIVIAQMAKLRQLTGGAILNEHKKLLPVASDKLKLLEEFIESRNVFKKFGIIVSFTHEIDLISKFLDSKNMGYLVLSGKTSAEARETIEEDFRDDPECIVIIIQAQTGGEGLDFTAASECITYSPTFSVIQWAQVSARFHRMNSDHVVTYIDFVMEGTIDEKIIEIRQRSLEMATDILDTKRTYKLRKGKKVNREKVEQLKLSLDTALDEIKNEIETNPPKPKIRKKRKMNDPVKKRVIKKKAVQEEAQEEAPTKKIRKKRSSPATMGDVAEIKTFGATGTYKLKDLAESMGMEMLDARKYLTLSGIEKPSKSWTWENAKCPEVKEAKAAIKGAMKEEKAQKAEKKKAKALAEREKIKAAKEKARAKATKEREKIKLAKEKAREKAAKVKAREKAAKEKEKLKAQKAKAKAKAKR